MKSPSKSIPVSIWRRYETYNLTVAPSLAGASHKFKQDGYDIEIKLPHKPKRMDWRNPESRINCWSYRRVNNKNIPRSYEIHSVDVVLNTSKNLKIPSSALGRVNYSNFNATKRKQLNRFAERYETIIETAFDRWVEVLRWKTGKHSLCLFRRNLQRSKWGTYLLHSSTRERFYSPGMHLTATLDSPLSKRSWKLAEEALINCQPVPIWHLYLSEARQKLVLEDVRGFILDLAIASETIVRRLIVKRLLSGSSKLAFEEAVGRLPVSPIVNNWFEIGFDSSGWRGLSREKGLISHVIDQRNRIMHRGEYETLSDAKWRERADAVAKFIAQGERELEKSR